VLPEGEQVNSHQRSGKESGPAGIDEAETWRIQARLETALDGDQTAADSDQTSADSDQTASDADQSASSQDQKGSDRDQRASDRDQATADRDRAADPPRTQADETAYDTSRDERETVSFARTETRLDRARTADYRDASAAGRDRVAEGRDAAGRVRDLRNGREGGGATAMEVALLEQLELLTAEAAADRARAATDRARAAADRANAARERGRLEGELRLAHLDQLTGAYRREMGRLALSHEIDRARRSDGRFILAFVDVDDLKTVNDRDGHAAGDLVLKTVVAAMRTRLRSFDPIIRYGGDEFVCGIGGTDLEEARHRFDAIEAVIRDAVGVGISVGLVSLGATESLDELTARADAAMLEVKGDHHTSR
jgi:diguanylate cyclase (GGDEF)-like protein